MDKKLYKTIKQLVKLGIIGKNTIVTKRKKKRKNTKKQLLAYNQQLAQSGVHGSSVTSTPTVASEQGIANLKLTQLALENAIKNKDIPDKNKQDMELAIEDIKKKINSDSKINRNTYNYLVYEANHPNVEENTSSTHTVEDVTENTVEDVTEKTPFEDKTQPLFSSQKSEVQSPIINPLHYQFGSQTGINRPQGLDLYYIAHPELRSPSINYSNPIKKDETEKQEHFKSPFSTEHFKKLFGVSKPTEPIVYNSNQTQFNPENLKTPETKKKIHFDKNEKEKLYFDEEEEKKDEIEVKKPAAKLTEEEKRERQKGYEMKARIKKAELKAREEAEDLKQLKEMYRENEGNDETFLNMEYKDKMILKKEIKRLVEFNLKKQQEESEEKVKPKKDKKK